jgi:hypothetical protein
MKKIKLFLVLLPPLLLAAIVSVHGQKSPYDRDREGEFTRSTADLANRTYNILDVNLFGNYVSNIGQFYSSWQEDAPEGEWPVGSGHEQLYRMNVFIGIPGNVVQTRSYGEKEWDPVLGYHDPDVGLTAVSNDTTTWPVNGSGVHYWPVRGENDDPVIFSDQDSYGVYRDSTNYLYISTQDPSYLLNIVVLQTTYAWNSPLDEDYTILKFEIINVDDDPRDSLYFCLYSDFDVGGGSGEYSDDFVGLDTLRNLFYMYDSDNWSSTWNDSAFYIGAVFLETPDGLGLTDFHYVDYYDDPSTVTNDPQQYGLMSSDSALWADSLTWPGLFHGSNIHFDDTSLIGSGGGDWLVYPSSGPYHMEPYDTLTFILAYAAGANYDDFSANIDRAVSVYEAGFEVFSVPQPIVYGFTGNNQVTLEWENQLLYQQAYVIDTAYVNPQYGANTLARYRIYKTEDPERNDWGDPLDSIALGDYTVPGLYRWIDNDVINGFYYSYTVVAYDSVDTLESGIARLADQINTVELRPGSLAQTTLSGIKVVPNPYVISAGWERERLGGRLNTVGEPIRELAFNNLPPVCTIKIFTMDGDLVKTLQHSDGTGTQYWDIRSDYNMLVVTGVYFYHVKSDQGEHVGKFAVIR